jgi:hypothetical protein
LQDDETTCPFIHSQVELMALEAKEQRLQTGKDVAGACCAGEELQMLKQTLDSVVAELWKMKMQPVEPMPAVKSEVDKKNMQIVLDSSFLAPVVVGFVGVLIGVFVAGMWK